MVDWTEEMVPASEDKPMGTLIRLGGLVAAAVLASGCATIVSDDDYLVTFTSTPDSEVTITNEDGLNVHREDTPFSVNLSASDGYFDGMSYSVLFARFCFEPVTIQLIANLDEWYWANVLFGGLIGFLIVDSATGAMWELDDRVSVALTEVPDCGTDKTDIDPTSRSPGRSKKSASTE